MANGQSRPGLVAASRIILIANIGKKHTLVSKPLAVCFGLWFTTQARLSWIIVGFADPETLTEFLGITKHLF